MKELGTDNVATASEAAVIPALDATSVAVNVEPTEEDAGDSEEMIDRSTVGIPVKFAFWLPAVMFRLVDDGENSKFG